MEQQLITWELIYKKIRVGTYPIKSLELDLPPIPV
jgi:hypothetical protein